MSSVSTPALSPEIGAGEQFTRFIFARSHFAPDNGRVKPQALLPRRNEFKSRWETSAHRIAGLNDAQVWQLGYAHVENTPQGRFIKARGTGAFDSAATRGLSLDVNGKPYPRHVDIVGWSDEKHDRLMKATEIADTMKLDLDPRSDREGPGALPRD